MPRLAPAVISKRLAEWRRLLRVYHTGAYGAAAQTSLVGNIVMGGAQVRSVLNMVASNALNEAETRAAKFRAERQRWERRLAEVTEALKEFE